MGPEWCGLGRRGRECHEEVPEWAPSGVGLGVEDVSVMRRCLSGSEVNCERVSAARGVTCSTSPRCSG